MKFNTYFAFLWTPEDDFCFPGAELLPPLARASLLKNLFCNSGNFPWFMTGIAN